MTQFLRPLFEKITQNENFEAFVKYVVIGISVTIIYIGGTTLSVDVLGWPVLVSNFFFYTLSTVLSYTANYYWSFSSSANHSSAFLKYIFIASMGLALNTAFIYVSSVVLKTPIWISTTIFAVTWPVFSFFAQKNFIYR